MTIDTEWLEAADILGIEGAARAAGWPDVLEAGQIARLQYPDSCVHLHKLSEHIRHDSLRSVGHIVVVSEYRGRFLEALQLSVNAGVLEAFPGAKNGLATDSSSNSERWAVHCRITRKALNDWLPEHKRSECIRAWLHTLELNRTPMKRKAIVEALERKYPKLEGALRRREPWATACSVPGRSGWYFFESLEAQCCIRYGGGMPRRLADDGFNALSNLHNFNR